MPAQAALFVNAKSRRGRELFDDAKEGLTSVGIELAKVEMLRSPEALRTSIKSALQEGIRQVIIGGGDGTQCQAASMLAHTDAVLGVLPFGTGNAFARDLGIPEDVSQACAIISEGRVTKVDLGLARERHFVNVATIGITTNVARFLDPEQKSRLGKIAYLFALVRAVSRTKPFSVRIRTERASTEFRTLQVVVGNGRYHGGPFPLSPDAAINDGYLRVYGLAAENRWALVKLAWHLRDGSHVYESDVPAYIAREIEIETDPIRVVTVDGELVERTPIQFRSDPASLNVIVPDTF